MESGLIPAEVSAQPQHEREAALAMQRLGVKVLHVGSTISVEAPQSLWESLFHVSFEDRSMRQMDALGERPFKRAVTSGLRIPAELRGLVTEVSFQEPPVLF
jgi:hypothetical protein